MPRTDLPSYTPKSPLLRGHVVDAAQVAYKIKKGIYSELWLEVLHAMGTHPLSEVPQDIISALSYEAKQFIQAHANHYQEQRKNQKMKKVTRKRKRA